MMLEQFMNVIGLILITIGVSIILYRKKGRW